MPSLRIHTIPGPRLDAHVLQHMSDLRRSVMTMKPATDLARDFAKFVAICKSCDQAMLFFDREQQLAGMYLLFFRRGQGYLLVLSEFAFMRPAYRGNPALARSLLRVLAQILMRWRGESIWFGGVGYPSALLAIQRFFGEMVLQGETGLQAMQQNMLELITAEFAGTSWLPEQGCAVMPTIPPQMSAIWHSKATQEPFFQRYLQLCPHWQQGYALPGVTRVRPFLLLRRASSKLVQRLFRAQQQ